MYVMFFAILPETESLSLVSVDWPWCPSETLLALMMHMDCSPTQIFLPLLDVVLYSPSRSATNSKRCFVILSHPSNVVCEPLACLLGCVVGWINTLLHREVHGTCELPGTCQHINWLGKVDFTNVIESLVMGRISWIIWRAWSNHKNKGPSKRIDTGEVREETEGHGMMDTEPGVMDFEDGGRATSQGMQL